jgi:hypothetical protein
MSRIDTLKLNADLLAMHDQPLRPDAADLNTLRDAMTIVSAHAELVKALRKIKREAADEGSNAIDSCNRIADIVDEAMKIAGAA